MGSSTRALVLCGIGLLSLACGDPLVVVGDAPGVFRIVAGVPDSAGTNLRDAATRSLLNGPRGLDVAGDGTLYIADHQNARIVAVASSGAIEAIIDHSQRQTEPRLRRPDGLALDGQERVLVADPEAHRVWRIDPASGDLVSAAGTGLRGSSRDTVQDARNADLDAPTGVAVAPDGTVYFSEFGGHRIRRLDPDGRLVAAVGDGLAGFSGDGGPARAARLRRPAGLELADGFLYIADSGNHRVRAVDLGTFTISTVAGNGVDTFSGDGGPAIEASLNTPHSVAFLSDGGLLFIADTDNHRVRVVRLPTGTIDTFAGTGDPTFNGNLLEAGQTSLAGPRGLVVSPLGFLFVADTEHQIVRRTAAVFVQISTARLP